ncbi:hypothetical protein [Streptomyces sp. NPDC004721]
MTDKDSVQGRLQEASSRFGWTLMVILLLITVVALTLMGILLPLLLLLGGTMNH